FSSRRRHTRFSRDWSSDVCSSDLVTLDIAGHCGSARQEQAVEASGGRQLRRHLGELLEIPDLLAVADGEPLAVVGHAHRLGEARSEEHTSELQSRENLVCRLLLEK